MGLPVRFLRRGDIPGHCHQPDFLIDSVGVASGLGAVYGAPPGEPGPLAALLLFCLGPPRGRCRKVLSKHTAVGSSALEFSRSRHECPCGCLCSRSYENWRLLVLTSDSSFENPSYKKNRVHHGGIRPNRQGPP